MRRREVLRISALASIGPIAGCSLNGPTSTRTVEMIDDLQFVPGSVDIEKGGTITWKNVGSVKHTITALEDQLPAEARYFASGDFESEENARRHLSDGLVGAHDTYEHTFGVTGRYEYVCLPHESSGMNGVVHVK